VAREATARLYDVTKESVVLTKLAQSQKYDQGTITFRAKKGKLLDLDKLHESIWATRLSGGTSSGLIKLEVTAVGEAVVKDKATILNVTGSDEHFLLAEDAEEKPANGQKTVFQRMQAALARGEPVVSVTGRLEGWHGRWPEMLRKLPPKPRKILVSSFETAKPK
jgi:hypothetical protein